MKRFISTISLHLVFFIYIYINQLTCSTSIVLHKTRKSSSLINEMNRKMFIARYVYSFLTCVFSIPAADIVGFQFVTVIMH